MGIIQSLFIPLLLVSTSVWAYPFPKKSANSIQILHEQNKKRYYDYGSMSEPMRGINIGGWLVLEPYITPSLFEAFRTNDQNDNGIPVDEYHYCQYLGHDVAKERLVNHWDTFYTEKDFASIASLGFNMVRIPIGYWAFNTSESDPYVTGLQEAYLDKAINWAANNSLKVWVDLHGASGSQNGFDNSGLRDSLQFLEDSNLALTTAAIDYILEKYSGEDFLETVVGIELINEPLGPSIDMDKLKYNYMEPAYNYLRNNLKRNQIIIIHDAFQPFNYWDNFLTLSDNNWGVVLDHHHYYVFSSGELAAPFEAKIQDACNWGTGALSEDHWTITGEFSAALTDCSKWLNGVGIGARYDGSYATSSAGSYYIGSCENNEDITTWSDERKQQTRRYIEAQLDAFELKDGWIFWCFKTESTIEWDVQRLVEYGLFPQPLTARAYPNQCSFS